MKALYFIQAGRLGPIKIGMAAAPLKRMADLQGANASELRLLHAAPDMGHREHLVHLFLREHRIRGEWFRPAEAVFEVIDAARDGRLLEHLSPLVIDGIPVHLDRIPA